MVCLQTGSILIPFFQQFTGINTIMFYATQLFDVLGDGSNSALLDTAIIGAVNVGSTILAIVLVDRLASFTSLPNLRSLLHVLFMIALFITTTTLIAVDVVTVTVVITAIAMTTCVACAVIQWLGARCMTGVAFSRQVAVATLGSGTPHIHLYLLTA